MHPTRNDLSNHARAQVEKLLNQRLAEALDLGAAAKQAHWNVKGPHFMSLHGLFDSVHGSVAEHVDNLAERITALGGTALGTLQAASRGSALQPYPEQLRDGEAHVAALADRLADFAARVRKSIGQAGEQGDEGTADLLTGISRELDKQLWFLEAHLHRES
jgi:starvation-inducible DNA-binding protein